MKSSISKTIFPYKRYIKIINFFLMNRVYYELRHKLKFDWEKLQVGFKNVKNNFKHSNKCMIYWEWKKMKLGRIYIVLMLWHKERRKSLAFKIWTSGNDISVINMYAIEKWHTRFVVLEHWLFWYLNILKIVL